MSETESRERTRRQFEFYFGYQGWERQGDGYLNSIANERWRDWQAADQATRERIAKGIANLVIKGNTPAIESFRKWLADAIEKGEIG